MKTDPYYKLAFVHPKCLILGDVTIGPFCSIGLKAEINRKWLEMPEGKVIVMDRAVITGHVTVDSGNRGNTIIGEDCFIMKHAHIGHDAQLGYNVTVSPGAKIGGECIIGDHCNIGMNAVIHQQVEIPAKCMIGMGAVITKKAGAQMKECETWAGNPARKLGINKKWL